MNTGTLYGVGIGPGDPKLMTFRAAELIRDNEIIALPGEKAEETVAYQIAVQTVEELKQKTFLELPMPMTKDRELLEKSHEEAADRVEECLQKGQNVVFLTLGDPTVYSTYLYVHKRIAQRGYRTELTSGITSFCAVAAKLNMSQTGYSKYETGENDVPSIVLIKLAKLYETSVDYLLGLTNNPVPYK